MGVFGERISPHPRPPDPSPQKFGVSLIKFDSGIVRIYGERGAIMEKRDSEVSATAMAALATLTTGLRSSISKPGCFREALS